MTLEDLIHRLKG